MSNNVLASADLSAYSATERLTGQGRLLSMILIRHNSTANHLWIVVWSDQGRHVPHDPAKITRFFCVTSDVWRLETDYGVSRPERAPVVDKEEIPKVSHFCCRPAAYFSPCTSREAYAIRLRLGRERHHWQVGVQESLRAPLLREIACHRSASE